MVPHTSDGRVLFAIPWHGHTLVGTTDTPIETATLEPVAMEQEIEFILATAGQYLTKAPTREDVLSVFAGIRPLVRSHGRCKHGGACRAIMSIHIDRSGLVTICGGKWTTYRHMAEDCVDQAATLAQLPEKSCVTHHLEHPRLSRCNKDSWDRWQFTVRMPARFGNLSSRARARRTAACGIALCEGEVIWAVRHEMARTVEDVLARRTRALFLNARAALEMAPVVADLMALELEWDQNTKMKHLAAFREVRCKLRAAFLIRIIPSGPSLSS